jgi:hypothetical protein
MVLFIFERFAMGLHTKFDAETTVDESSPRSSFISKVGGPLVKAAAATAAVAAVAQFDDSGTVHGAVVSWNDANLSIPPTLDGLYINVETRATGSSTSAVPGWDINPYGLGALKWYSGSGTGNAMLLFPGVTTGSAGNLSLGTVVGSSGSYSTFTTDVVFGLAPGNWQLNADNYFGFRFVGADAGTKYGWGKMVVGSSSLIRTIESLHYEDTGASISVGDVAPLSAVPEPTSVSIFAMGAVGVLVRRRLRGQKKEINS